MTKLAMGRTEILAGGGSLLHHNIPGPRELEVNKVSVLVRAEGVSVYIGPESEYLGTGGEGYELAANREYRFTVPRLDILSTNATDNNLTLINVGTPDVTVHWLVVAED